MKVFLLFHFCCRARNGRKGPAAVPWGDGRRLNVRRLRGRDHGGRHRADGPDGERVGRPVAGRPPDRPVAERRLDKLRSFF